MMDPSLFQRCMFGSGRKGDKECLSLPPKKGGNNGREREMCCSVMRAFLTIQIKFCFYHNRCINSTSSWQNNALMQFWQTQLNIMCRLFTQPPPSLLHLKEKNDPPPRTCSEKGHHQTSSPWGNHKAWCSFPSSEGCQSSWCSPVFTCLGWVPEMTEAVFQRWKSKQLCWQKHLWYTAEQTKNILLMVKCFKLLHSRVLLSQMAKNWIDFDFTSL